MINSEFLELLRKYGEIRIQYMPPMEDTHLGDFDEAVVFQVYEGNKVVGNSGAYVMKGLDATLDDDSLDELAARLVQSVKRYNKVSE